MDMRPLPPADRHSPLLKAQRSNFAFLVGKEHVALTPTPVVTVLLAALEPEETLSFAHERTVSSVDPFQDQGVEANTT